MRVIITFLILFAVAALDGHDWRNPDSYDADNGSAVDWWLMQFDAVADAKLYLC